MAYKITTTYTTSERPRFQEIADKLNSLGDNIEHPPHVTIDSSGQEIITRAIVDQATAEELCGFVNDFYAAHPEHTFFVSSVIEEVTE